MPHLILEFSDNVIEQDRFSDLFQQCHQTLAEKLPTNLMSCKSRAIPLEHFYLGDGAESLAFVHGTLKIMPGRTEEVLNQTAEALMSLFKAHFQETAKARHLQLSLEIVSLNSPYVKC